LNFDLSLKMFALSWHMGFWMSFLKFESEQHAASALATFRLSLDSDLVRGLLMTVFGAAAAVLASLLPFPLAAIGEARRTSQDVTTVLTDTWQDAIEWFAGQAHNSMQKDRLVHNVQVLRTSIVSLQGHVANAWWECFGLGSVQKACLLLEELNTLLLHTKDRLLAVMFAGPALGAKHARVMGVLQPKLSAVTTEAGALMRLVTEAAGDGHLDDEEVESIMEQEAATSKACDDLSNTFWCIEEAHEADMVHERAFCMHCCAYGRGVIAFADAMIGSRKQQRPYPFRWSLAGVADKMWFARNSISICLTFTIGYMGYHQMIRAYDAGPAVTASLLLSTFIGSAMLKNMGRLQGVAFGTAVGQLAYAMFAWCRGEGDVAVALFLFTWVLATLYMYYSSAQFGFIGCLLAAFGSANVLQGCSSNETYHPSNLAYKVINCVVGIIVMTAVDMILVPKPACQLAYEAYMDFWTRHTDAIHALFDPSARIVHRQEGKLLEPLLLAESLGNEANKEPRFWRTPWRHALWTDSMSYAFELRVDVITIERSLAEGTTIKSQELLKTLASPAFDAVKEHVLAKISAIHVLLSALAWEKESDGFHNIDVEKAALHLGRPTLAQQLSFGSTANSASVDVDEARYLADLQAALFEGAEHVPADHRSLEEDGLSRLSVLFTALGLLLRHLDDLKHRLLREGA
jgi:hypothetical protein